MPYKETCSLCKGNGYITIVVEGKDEIKQCWLCESKGESSKQYTTLVLELNIMAKNWNKFGVDIRLPGQEKIIKWGQKKGRDIPTEAPN